MRLGQGLYPLFDIASTQVLHRPRSRVEWSKDVLFAVNPQRRQVAKAGAGLDSPRSGEDRLERSAMEPSVLDELVGRISLADCAVAGKDARVDGYLGHWICAPTSAAVSSFELQR